MVRIGLREVSSRITAPLRRPGAVGRKLISTLHEGVAPVELLQVVLGPAVKSRLCVPKVDTVTPPRPPVIPVVNGRVSVTALEDPSVIWPNPTADWFNE